MDIDTNAAQFLQEDKNWRDTTIELLGRYKILTHIYNEVHIVL